MRCTSCDTATDHRFLCKLHARRFCLKFFFPEKYFIFENKQRIYHRFCFFFIFFPIHQKSLADLLPNAAYVAYGKHIVRWAIRQRQPANQRNLYTFAGSPYDRAVYALPRVTTFEATSTVSDPLFTIALCESVGSSNRAGFSFRRVFCFSSQSPLRRDIVIESTTATASMTLMIATADLSISFTFCQSICESGRMMWGKKIAAT